MDEEERSLPNGEMSIFCCQGEVHPGLNSLRMVFLTNCPTKRSRRMHLKTIFNRVTDYKPFVVDRVELTEDALARPTIEISMLARMARRRVQGADVVAAGTTRCRFVGLISFLFG